MEMRLLVSLSEWRIPLSIRLSNETCPRSDSMIDPFEDATNILTGEEGARRSNHSLSLNMWPLEPVSAMSDVPVGFSWQVNADSQ